MGPFNTTLHVRLGLRHLDLELHESKVALENMNWLKNSLKRM